MKGSRLSQIRAKIKVPVGLTDDVPFFDNQSNDSTTFELLTINEAAELLTISVSGVRRLQQGRRIPFFKVGGGIRFAKRDLASYLEQHRVESIDK